MYVSQLALALAVSFIGWIGAFVYYEKHRRVVRHHRACILQTSNAAGQVVHELVTILNTTSLTWETVVTVRGLAASEEASPLVQGFENMTKDAKESDF